MPTEVVMPQMGESITEGTLTKWLKMPGDTVARDEPLFEISTDKVDAEIPSPAAGTLGEIKVKEGSTVNVGALVCTIEEGGSGAGTTTAAPPAVQSASPHTKETADVPQLTTPAPEGVAIPSPAAPAARADAGPGTEVLMPQMGESITEGTITKWLKKVGDTVARDEPIFEISTDKVDAEIPSPIAGVLSAIKVEEGATVTINTVVAVIGGAAGAPAAATPSAVQSASPHTRETADVPQLTVQAPAGGSIPSPATSASAGEGLRSSPLVRKMASENNIDLSRVAGTGASGRITKQDMLGHLDGTAKGETAAGTAAAVTPAAINAAPVQAPTAPAPPQSKPASTPASQPAPGELVPMSKMRSIIAKRMVESKHTNAHVHTVFKVDMTRIVKLREKEKNKYEQRNGAKLTYMPFITRAAIQALKKHPIVNASTEGDAIRYNKNINIGIAVALEWGLIVPVIKQTEERNFLGITRAIVDLADRARNKKLAPDEVAGGTFTLTNAGIFGEQFGTPIIAAPQSAILGIGGLNKEPMVLTDKDGNDSIAIRWIQRFTLGFDHRIIDGSDAGKFMSDFKAFLENWSEDIG